MKGDIAMRKRRFWAFVLTLILAIGLSAPAAAGSMGKADTGVTVSTGGCHTAVLQEDGILWTCGANSYGQLGVGTQSLWGAEPTQILSDAAVAWARETGLTDGLEFTATDLCPRADVVYCIWKQMNGTYL